LVIVDFVFPTAFAAVPAVYFIGCIPPFPFVRFQLFHSNTNSGLILQLWQIFTKVNKEFFDVFGRRFLAAETSAVGGQHYQFVT